MTVSSIATGYDGISLLAGNTAYDPAATFLIQRVNGTGSSQTITFSSIPSGYVSLQIRGIVRSTEAGSGTNFSIQVNGDTGSNYAQHRLLGNGTTATASGTASQTSIFAGRAPGAGTTAGTMNVTIVDIHDYLSTNKYKTIRIITGQDSNNTYAGEISLRSGLWMSTSAITSISFVLDNPNFANTTTFALYGMK